jgi:hypothetical protein
MPEQLEAISSGVFTEEQVQIAKEAMDSFSDGLSHLLVPFVVIDGERARESILRAKDGLSRLI